MCVCVPAVESTATWESRYVPHGVCESSQQAVLSQLEWSNVSAAGGGSVLCSASCVSGSVLFLAPFPSLSHPAVSGSGYHTLCARHPSWLHLHHTLSSILPQWTYPTLPESFTTIPLSDCCTHARTRTSSRSAVRAGAPEHYREMVVIVVSQEPVELKMQER